MKVSIEKIPESQVVMTIEIEPERLDKAREKAVRKLSPKAKVPGFRPGKAPPDMVRRYFGDERILDEALDDLVPDAYIEALKADESIDAVGRPRLVIETTEPLVVKATIPVRPTIELNDYQSVRVKVEPIEIDESRVDETILTLRRRTATLEPIERPVSWRDVVRLNVVGTVDGGQMVEQQEAEIQLVEGRPVLFPGFEDAIIGAAKGDDVTFDLPVPDTVRMEKFAGKQCHFVVEILEAKEEVLPELNDDFLKALGEGFESVDALRDRVRDDIRKHAEEQRNNRYHDEILGELVERATLEFPPVMLESEIERILHEQARSQDHGREMEQYLASIGKTEEEVREELRPIADIRLRRSLVLSKVSDVENIDVTDDDITAEIDVMTAAAGPQGGQLRQMFDSENGRDTIRRNMLTRKTLDRLVEIATQDGGAESTAEVEKPAKAKKKKKAAAKAKASESPVEALAPADDAGGETGEQERS